MNIETHVLFSRAVFFLLALTLVLTACGKDPVVMVKEGTLTFDASVKVGNALDGYQYFLKKEWRQFKGSQQRTVVQFTGQIDLNAYMDKGNAMWSITADQVEKAKKMQSLFNYVAQFAINQDGKSFSLHYSGLEIRVVGAAESVEVKDFDLSMIRNIYENALDLSTLKQLIELFVEYEKRNSKK